MADQEICGNKLLCVDFIAFESGNNENNKHVRSMGYAMARLDYIFRDYPKS